MISVLFIEKARLVLTNFLILAAVKKVAPHSSLSRLYSLFDAQLCSRRLCLPANFRFPHCLPLGTFSRFVEWQRTHPHPRALKNIMSYLCPSAVLLILTSQRATDIHRGTTTTLRSRWRCVTRPIESPAYANCEGFLS